MTKPYHKPPTPIDQAEIVDFPSLEKLETAQFIGNEVNESLVFLAGALRIIIEMEDKSKTQESLGLLPELLRGIYLDFEELQRCLNNFASGIPQELPYAN